MMMMIIILIIIIIMIIIIIIIIILWLLFMDGVQLSQSYRNTTRRKFTFYHLVPISSWYSFNRPRKDERLPASGFEFGTPGFGIQHLNYQAIALMV